MVRKIIGVILLLPLVLILNCNKCSDQKPRDTYFMPLSGNIQSLNPRMVRFRPDYKIMRAIFGQLVGTDKDGYLSPEACFRWEISPDFKNYTLFLREDIQFHDGVPFTADDVLFSFEYGGKKPTLLYKILSDIEGYEDYFEGRSTTISGIKVPDKHTVKISLKDPSTTFLYALADARLVILPNKFHGVDEKDFFVKPIGLGPYIFESWENDIIKMKRNDNFYGQKGRIERFVFLPMSKSEALKKFEAHAVDDLATYKVDPSEIKRKDVNIYRGKGYGTHLLFFNVSKPPMDNEYLRLAVRAAFDKDKLVRKCYPDDDVAVGIIPTGLLGAIDDTDKFSDLNKPVDYYISKAGLKKNQIPKITMIRFDEMKDDCFKPAIEEMFKANGLSMEVEFMSYEDGLKKIKKNDYHILSDWLGVRSVDPIGIIHFFDGRSTWNLSNVNDKEVNRLIDIAESMRTKSARAEVYRQINEIIVRKVYAIDLQYENRYFIYDKLVSGVDNPNPITFLVGFNDIWFASN